MSPDREDIPIGAGFSESGRLEPVVLPPGPSDTDLAMELLERLRVDQTPKSLGAVEEFLREVSWRRAADALTEILIKLDGTAAGTALRRAICGDGGLSLRDEAERIGCSHVAVHKQQRRVKERLGG